MQHTRSTALRLWLSLALLLAWLPVASPADESLQTEHRVKAAFLYNFARFITWPELPAGEFTLCVLGSNALGEQLDMLLNKTVHERQLRVMHLNSTKGLDQCQLVFVGRSHAHQLRTVMSALRDRPVLTVSDIDDFILSGGMIGFRLIDNKVRFEINTAAAGSAGLSISSKLLTLATTIRSGN
ncbi:MAG: YfiR family protein [Gammaproteobacteria bacterium]